MIWEPIDFVNKFTCLGKNSSFFLQRIHDKYYLFIHESELTCLLVLQLEGNRLIVDAVKNITSEQSVFKITGNNNGILMLDIKGEFFYLQGSLGTSVEVFNHNNGNNFLSDIGTLSWQRLHQLSNCLTMMGLTNCVTFLYHDSVVYGACYETVNLKNGLCEMSKKSLDYFDCKTRYFVGKIEGELAKIIGEKVIKGSMQAKEVLLILEQCQMYFSMSNEDDQILSKPYSVDVQNEIIIDVLSFENHCLILIVCKSGKIICLNFNHTLKSFHCKNTWLPKAVSAIVGYEDENIYLLWSDLNTLYMSIFDYDNMILKSLSISQNIRGVKHLVKLDENIIIMTVNACFYGSKFRSGVEMQKLIDEVIYKEDLLEALHISRIPKNICNNLHVTEKKGIILIENKSEYLFQKRLWRLLIEKFDSPNIHLEIKELEGDIIPGGNISFECSQNMQNNVMLICDIMDYVLAIELQVKIEESETENEDQLHAIKQFLKQNCTFIV